LLMMLCVKHSLPPETFTTVVQRDYRFVPDTFDQAGGCFAMFGSWQAPGEPVPPLEFFVWRDGEEKPVSQDVSLIGETLDCNESQCELGHDSRY